MNKLTWLAAVAAALALPATAQEPVSLALDTIEVDAAKAIPAPEVSTDEVSASLEQRLQAQLEQQWQQRWEEVAEPQPALQVSAR
jgi:hypothetical protein